MVRPKIPPVSCRLELLPGTRVSEQLEAAGRYGFDGVALPGRFVERWLVPLREAIAGSPVALAGISLGFQGSLLSPEAVVRRQCQTSLLRLLDLAAELRTGWINAPPCLIQDNPVRITDRGHHASLAEHLDALLIEQLPALGDAARDRELLLLLEPVNHQESDYLNSIEHAARLCARLNHPAIGCTADFFHMQSEERDVAGALRQAAPAIRHVQVADNTRVEPGSGSLDFKPGFRALREAGYAGWLEIEARHLSGPPEAVLPKSVQCLRKTWLEA